MSENKSDAQLATPESHAARLRKAGLIILLAGFALGGLIYLFGPQDTLSDDNTAQSQYYKMQEVEAQRLWGNQGSLILELNRSLGRASTYSVLVIVVSAVVSFVCFFWASHPHGGKKE